MSDFYTPPQTELPENHTLHSGTYLNSLYVTVPLHSPSHSRARPTLSLCRFGSLPKIAKLGNQCMSCLGNSTCLFFSYWPHVWVTCWPHFFVVPLSWICVKGTQSALWPHWPGHWFSHFEESSPQPGIIVDLETHSNFQCFAWFSIVYW